MGGLGREMNLLFLSVTKITDQSGWARVFS